MTNYLDFESQISEMDGKIKELRHISDSGSLDIATEIKRLEHKIQRQLEQLYKKLDPWRKVQVARHPDRPRFKSYIDQLITDFQPLCGDRNYGDDHAIIGGMGRFNGRSVMVIGSEKGNDVESRIHHNFGMARPEGYRKAMRLMQLAQQFNLPVISFVDTPGAYPGVGAEERGQAEAIARSIATCLSIRVPIISLIVGEGGSGGAIAIATGDRVAMLEHSIYSVISPEGCASILWRGGGDHVKAAAEALKLTAQDLKSLELIDHIIEEPLGGAHRFPKHVIKLAGEFIQSALDTLNEVDADSLITMREEKYLAMGRLKTDPPASRLSTAKSA
ncbi:MAG: acetyl-CoA carboxylase carboxyltransferase subunit alpha [Alphaproteobacteria bacterium]